MSGSLVYSKLAIVLATLLGSSALTDAGCDLAILSAGPCLSDGSAGLAHVGDPYALKVAFKVTVKPSSAFRIEFTLANVTWYSEPLTLAQRRSGWWYGFVWNLNLDDSMPRNVTLDPDGLSGDTNLLNNTARGVLTPVAPSAPVEFYAARLVHGFETCALSFEEGSGQVNKLWMLFGDRTSHAGGLRKSLRQCRRRLFVLFPRNPQTKPSKQRSKL